MESSISASLIIQLPVALGTYSAHRGTCRTSKIPEPDKTHPAALLFFLQAGLLVTSSHHSSICEYSEWFIGRRINPNLQNIFFMPLLKFCFYIFMPRSSFSCQMSKLPQQLPRIKISECLEQDMQLRDPSNFNPLGLIFSTRQIFRFIFSQTATASGSLVWVKRHHGT